MAQEQFNIKQHESVNVRKPRKYFVVFHNDDFTTMDFVVQILKEVFFKSEIDAFTIMMDVHNSGKGVVGTYSYDMAHTKKEKATAMAREEGFPLKITIQPA